jgi:hypothetical protein
MHCILFRPVTSVSHFCTVYWQELKGRDDLEKFVQSQADTVLTVVNVSSSNATACVRVFAAIAALAKSFKGYAAFARLLYDTSDELTQLARELRVVEVCTLTYSAAKILNQCCSKLPVIQRCSGCWRRSAVYGVPSLCVLRLVRETDISVVVCAGAHVHFLQGW